MVSTLKSQHLSGRSKGQEAPQLKESSIDRLLDSLEGIVCTLHNMGDKSNPVSPQWATAALKVLNIFGALNHTTSRTRENVIVSTPRQKLDQQKPTPQVDIWSKDFMFVNAASRPLAHLGPNFHGQSVSWESTVFS